MDNVLPTKKRIFEDRQIPTEGGDELYAKLMFPRPPAEAQRVVLIPPLVGAGAGQALLTFRDFSKRGAIMIHFAYRGHPGSTGVFELDRTVVDAHHGLMWALKYADDRGLPLHGFATCYGAIPLLAQFTKGRCGPLLRSINTISGLYHLNQILRIEDFAPLVSRHLGRAFDASSLVAGIAEGTLDCEERRFKGALQEYLSSLMPELRVELDYFEELKYERVNMRRTLLQFYRADYLDDVHVPPRVPCTACVGRQDELLYAHTEEGRNAYQECVLSIVPHATYHEFDMDHYGRGPGHNPVIKCVGDAFERSETTLTSPGPVYKTPHYHNHVHVVPR